MSQATGPVARQAEQDPPEPTGPSFDPWGADLQDPYRVLSRLRSEQPVFFSPEVNAWCVTRYDDVSAVIRDTARFSSAETFPRPQGLPPAADKVITNLWDEAPMVTFLDPPEHTRVRTAMTGGFTPRAVAGYEPLIREIVTGVIGELGGRREFDLVSDYAEHIPIRSVLGVMGIPAEDNDAILTWVRQGFTLFVGYRAADEATLLDCVHGQKLFTDYVTRLIEERRERPRADLISVMATSGGNGRGLLDGEIVTQVMTMIAAGHETTSNAITNTVNAMLRTPGAWPAYVAGELDTLAIVNEGLRLDTPVLGLFRVAKRDTTIGGAEIPAGAMVLLVIASANHDESKYARPAQFEPDRPRSAQSLAFGGGVHYCIGAPLALLELRVALEELAGAYPTLRLASSQPPVYRPMSQFRGIDRLPVLAP